ncbi:methionine--tRNA ligase [Mycoplasmopsis columbinasalis]|uniref:Methionine--tRNA ligase n=1 Tax=Mycoplasmopsis columbinasalis TaxID=114880 RepID=A0A449B9X8_9BACT|nr:methionine--tRNA ligase [Mycoplasmopsis columbinasalis]VEU77993.1 Methionine--tRNA ligase [Mycoplasmopsis columbinasalis]
MSKKTFYVTTPIYYASGPLHIGHLYCTIMAWTIANYKKSQGYDAKFLTGSDEHGQKIANKAKPQNKEPKQFVDELVETCKQMWAKWDINYDYFSRTTSAHHEEAVKQVFSWFLANDFIYKDRYEGLYSIEDEEFLAKNQAVFKDGEYFHPSSGHKLAVMSEESYFFKIKKMQAWWVEYVKTHPNFLLPQKTVNEMFNNFVNEGLEDLSVTRTNVAWAIPIKEDFHHTLYVWLDALFNYVTTLGYSPSNPKAADYVKYWENGTEIVHILGKEISRFHFIYWPMFLEALGLRQPTTIISHGLLRDKDGRKMSKSLHNVIEPDTLFNKFDDEMIKYYFASQVIFGEDANFGEEKLKEVVNADLVNNFGNLISRTLKMLSNSFDHGIVYKTSNEQVHLEIENEIKSFLDNYVTAMDAFHFDKGLKLAIELSDKLNKYIDKTMPWKLTNNLPELSLVLSRLLNGIYAVAFALQVSLPRKIAEVATALGVTNFDKDALLDFHKFDNVIPAKQFMLYERLK